MIGVISLGVDLAKLMGAPTQLQNAADAGALAGASGLLPNTIPPHNGGSADTAYARAKATTALNYAYKNQPAPIILKDSDIVVNMTRRTCQVTARRDPADGGGEGV